MSQAKVEEYKKNKANREKNSRKERRKFKMEMTIFFVLVIAGIAFFGFAIVNNAASSASSSGEYTTTTLNTTAVDDYVNSIESASTAE